MEKLDLEQLKQIIKEVVIKAMQEFEESKTKEVSEKAINADCEINPSKKYTPQDAHKLIGVSIRHLFTLGEQQYQLRNQQTNRSPNV